MEMVSFFNLLESSVLSSLSHYGNDTSRDKFDVATNGHNRSVGHRRGNFVIGDGRVWVKRAMGCMHVMAVKFI